SDGRLCLYFFFQAEDGIRDRTVTGVQTCALPISASPPYDWEAMLSFLEARAIPGVELVAGSSYKRSIAFGTHSGAVTVTPAGGRSEERRVGKEGRCRACAGG